MLQIQGFVLGKGPTIDPHHPGRKFGHPSCENPNKAPESITVC